MASISFRSFTKTYDNGFQAVKGIDLTIRDQEFMVLVGPSGCGKTTSLRMVAGLEDITHGDLLIGDRRVNDVEPKDRDIAMVFQSYALYPQMTVAENMAYALTLRKVPKERIATIIQDVAKTLNLTAQLGKLPKQLSGGQRQRVALGRAIVRQPQVFLFDEPLSNLDAKLRGEMRAELRALQKRLATTAIYVTHDQVEAMTLGDRITVMNAGRIQQVADPMTIYEHPWNLFTARFIGTPPMNMLTGHLTANGLEVAGRTLPIVRTPAMAGLGDRKVCLGIRPEHLLAGAVDGLPQVSAEVAMVEMMGDHQYLHLRLDQATDLVVMKADTTIRPKPQDTITVSIDLGRAHLFDGTTDEARNLSLPAGFQQVQG